MNQDNFSQWPISKPWELEEQHGELSAPFNLKKKKREANIWIYSKTIKNKLKKN
jgi:hypothetical protein